MKRGHYKKRDTYICKWCKKTFTPKNDAFYHRNSHPIQYCSRKCGRKCNIGKTYTIQHKEKLRKAKLRNPTRYWLGKKRLDTSKLMKRLRLGIPLSEETKRKIAIALKGLKRSEECKKRQSERQKGNKSILWRGGISKIHKRIRAGLKFRLWRGRVYKRDDYTCQKCKKRGGYLHPHHIKSFAVNKMIRFDIQNGITLCISCHKEFHKKYGYGKNNEIQLKEFITNQ